MGTLASFGLLWLLLFPVSAFAQVGTVRGQVMDADFGQPVPDAQVNLTDRGISTTTNNEGFFTFPNLEPGSAEIQVSRSGFESSRRQQVAVGSGRVTETRITITAQVLEFDEFVVTGEDLAQTAGDEALKIQAQFDGLVNVLGEDFISKSTKGNVGELLTQIVGTSTVDSRFVVVRGLSDRYNTVYLNGLRIPSSDPDRRAVNVDIFPSSVVSSLSNAKTFSSENPGESTGGHINIGLKGVPKENFFKASWDLEANTLTHGAYARGVSAGGFRIPFDGGLESLDFPGSFSDVSDDVGLGTVSNLDPNFSFSASAGQIFQWDDAEAGITGAILYKRQNEFQNLEIGRAEFRPAQEENVLLERYRGVSGTQSVELGILVAGGLRFGDDDEINATVFSNIVTEVESNVSAGFNEERPGLLITETTFQGFDPGALRDYAINESRLPGQRQLITYQLAGSHGIELPGLVDTGKLDWAASYSTTRDYAPDQQFAAYAYRRDPGATGRRPRPPRNTFQLPENDFALPLFERTWRDIQDSAFSVGSKVEFPLMNLGKKTANLKFGGSFDSLEREFTSRSFEYNLEAPNPFVTPSVSYLESLDYSIENIDSVLDIADPARTTTPLREAHGFFEDNPSILRDAFGGLQEYSATESILSFFTAVDFPVTQKFDVAFGARMELTDITVRPGIDIDAIRSSTFPLLANALLFNPATAVLRDESVLSQPTTTNQADILPSFTGNWEFAENMSVRAALSRTIARPTFKEIAPAVTRQEGDNTLFIGNPDLEISSATNLDVRLEWLPRPGDTLAISGFTKLIDRPIELARASLGQIDFESAINENSARVYGLEVEIQNKLDWANPVLENVSVGFNYAFIRSFVQLEERNERSRTGAGLSAIRPLQGQPDSIINFNITYDNADYGLNAGFFLNVVGNTLAIAGGSQFNALGSAEGFVDDVTQRPFTSLDFSIGKRIASNWELGFEVSNITDSVLRREYASDATLFSEVQRGVTYKVGLKGSW